MDRGDQARRTELLAAATGPKRAPDRAGGREAACHDAVVGGREGRGDRGAGRDAVSACARTLCEKVWDAHVVHRLPEGPELLYVDLHLVHEVTSPQAFDGLRLAGRRVRRPDLTVATVDHNVPTGDRSLPIADGIAARQVEALSANAGDFRIELFDLASPQQGIVHVTGPAL